MDGVLSVYRNGKWVYYRCLANPKPMGQKKRKEMLTGSFGGNFDPKGELGSPELGMTPEEAALPLPSMSIKVGKGSRALGRVAVGPDLSSNLGNFALGAGVCTLVWYLSRPQEKSVENEE